MNIEVWIQVHLGGSGLQCIIVVFTDVKWSAAAAPGITFIVNMDQK